MSDLILLWCLISENAWTDCWFFSPQAGCGTMSSPQSGDISGYHLSGEWATLIRPSQHFLSAWLSLYPLYPLLKCVKMFTKLRDCLRAVIQGVWMCLLWGLFDSCWHLYIQALQHLWRLSTLQNILTYPIIGLSLMLKGGDKAVKINPQKPFISKKPDCHRFIIPLCNTAQNASRINSGSLLSLFCPKL